MIGLDWSLSKPVLRLEFFIQSDLVYLKVEDFNLGGVGNSEESGGVIIFGVEKSGGWAKVAFEFSTSSFKLDIFVAEDEVLLVKDHGSAHPALERIELAAV